VRYADEDSLKSSRAISVRRHVLARWFCSARSALAMAISALAAAAFISERTPNGDV
jgi:predicted anti-sigma-YlaC factor YlaD